MSLYLRQVGEWVDHIIDLTQGDDGPKSRGSLQEGVCYLAQLSMTGVLALQCNRLNYTFNSELGKIQDLI